MNAAEQPKDTLTLRQRKFVDKYLETGNATEAARFAGYKGDDASLASAGSRLLRNAKVRAAINEQLEAWKIGAERVWIFHRQVLDSSPDDFYDITDLSTLNPAFREGVARIPLLNLDKARKRGVLHLVKSISITDKGLKLEFYDKQASADAIAKMHGLLVQKTEVTGKDGGPITVRTVRFSDLPEEEEAPVPEGQLLADE